MTKTPSKYYNNTIETNSNKCYNYPNGADIVRCVSAAITHASFRERQLFKTAVFYFL